MAFPHADPLDLRLLEKMLSFEPKDIPTSEEALADPYFKNLAKVERELSCQLVTKLEFEFERRRIRKEDSLEYHPKMLKEYLDGSKPPNFMYPRAFVLYSDNNHAAAQQSSVEFTDGLSKCSIRDTERLHGADRRVSKSLKLSNLQSVP
ncbi:hypothetical protein HID58_029611 [Brassica napus]|uniref:Uncharacterized protein n=1 Tax=Brassica napus TaxID=3708 RepID=A0ABQ8CDP4_BRANA|nr:hypothetical protein HID58_029611 [Brassica napus]